MFKLLPSIDTLSLPLCNVYVKTPVSIPLLVVEKDPIVEPGTTFSSTLELLKTIPVGVCGS